MGERKLVELTYAQMIADYLHSVADWRRRRALEEAHEPRHKQAAKLMEELADYVAALDPEDLRLEAIGRATREGEQMAPGPILANAVARFGFYSNEISLDGLVTNMTELAMEDLGQAGRDPLRDLPF
jgi:hypothetical protein